MRLAKPRIQPLKDSEFTDEQKERLGKAAERTGGVLNIFRTLVRILRASARS